MCLNVRSRVHHMKCAVKHDLICVKMARRSKVAFGVFILIQYRMIIICA